MANATSSGVPVPINTSTMTASTRAVASVDSTPSLVSSTQGSASEHVPTQHLPLFSTPLVPESLFYSSSFMLGGGMVIIQPSSRRIVVVHEEKREFWFLPKGRKDIGESLEEAALREAYEESGYRATLLPLWQDIHAPPPPNSIHAQQWAPTTEPIAVQLTPWRSRRKPTAERHSGGEYLISWYVGQIPADAVPERNTGMPDEVNYRAHLLSIEDARRVLADTTQLRVVEMAWSLWLRTLDFQERERKRVDEEAAKGEWDVVHDESGA